MTKVSESWSNRDIQRDPQGYLAAQAKEREQAAAVSEKDRATDDFERFKRQFTDAGGDENSAHDEWRRVRNARAVETAKAREQATQREMYQSRMRAV